MILNILPLLAAKRLLLLDNDAEVVLHPTVYGLAHPVPMWFFGVLTGISIAVFVVTLYILYRNIRK